MIARITRRATLGLGIAIAAAGVAIAVIVAFAFPSGPSFPRLVPRAAPATCRHAVLPGRTAVLSYPPSLQPVEGDKDSVSAARLSPAGAYLLYLNATPQQGEETLQNWATLRLELLREDDASSAHEVSTARESGSTAAPDRVSSTTTSPGSAPTITRRSLAWRRGGPARAWSSRPRLPPSGRRHGHCWSRRSPPMSSVDAGEVQPGDVGGSRSSGSRCGRACGHW